MQSRESKASIAVKEYIKNGSLYCGYADRLIKEINLLEDKMVTNLRYSISQTSVRPPDHSSMFSGPVLNLLPQIILTDGTISLFAAYCAHLTDNNNCTAFLVGALVGCIGWQPSVDLAHVCKKTQEALEDTRAEYLLRNIREPQVILQSQQSFDIESKAADGIRARISKSIKRGSQEDTFTLFIQAVTRELESEQADSDLTNHKKFKKE